MTFNSRGKYAKRKNGRKGKCPRERFANMKKFHVPKKIIIAYLTFAFWIFSHIRTHFAYFIRTKKHRTTMNIFKLTFFRQCHCRSWRGTEKSQWKHIFVSEFSVLHKWNWKCVSSTEESIDFFLRVRSSRLRRPLLFGIRTSSTMDSRETSARESFPPLFQVNKDLSYVL